MRPVVDATSPCRRAIFRQAGLPTTIVERSARMLRKHSDALWQAAVDHTDAALPLRVASRVEPRTYGHFTYLIAAMPTVGEALRAVCRYYPTLIGNTTKHRVDASARVVRLDIDPLGHRPPCVNLFSVAVVASFMRRHAGVVPRRALVSHDLDPSSHGLAERALHCPVELSTSRLALEFAIGDLGRRLEHADPQLRDLLEDHARWKADATPSTRTAVEAQLEERGLSPGLRASDVADTLGMSLRTLRRRLAAESTSFQAVLDDALSKAALDHLRLATVDETACALGYADGSALRRAYKRWFGTAPRDLNRRASRVR